MAPKYNPQWFVPPKAVRNNAERGLEMRKKTGRGGLTPAQASNAGAGGKPIGSGVQRAVNLKNGSSLSPQTIKMMSPMMEMKISTWGQSTPRTDPS